MFLKIFDEFSWVPEVEFSLHVACIHRPPNEDKEKRQAAKRQSILPLGMTDGRVQLGQKGVILCSFSFVIV